MSKRSPARSAAPAGRKLERQLPAELFKALSDPNRIALLARLAACSCPCTVSELTCCCDVDLSVVSRHLAQLRRAGLVEAERSGREVRYTARCGEIAATLRAIAESLEQCASSCCGTTTTRRSN